MNKVNIVLEFTNQPPFETNAAIFHKEISVESDELYDALANCYSSCRVIAGIPVTPLPEPPEQP